MRVVDELGGPDITYESVAREAGLTKAGLMYHFPTKDDLMVAVIEYVIDRWKAELLTALEKPLEQTSIRERVSAFVRFAGQGGVTIGEFVVFSESLRRPALSGPWTEYLRTWFDFGSNVAAVPMMAAFFAANGLWIAEATDIVPVDTEQRERLIELLSGMAEEGTDER
jgi:AcrR family transcriptional regulator